MDDQTIATLCDDFGKVVTVSVENYEPPLIHKAETVEVNIDSGDESNVSIETPEISYQEQTLPIFQKIEDLTTKVHDLRKEHAALNDEVKGITADSFPGPEVFCALKDLGMQHEHLRRKYNEECALLKKRYLDECSERKRLYNEVIELKGNIRVFCRCRPLNAEEVANGSTSVVDFDMSQENEIQIVSSDSSRKQFRFDHVFKPEDGQGAVFVETMPIVTSVLDGFNVCIFAYGQTGTGKTFTMEGTPENRGVNYRTLERLFSLSSERSSIMKYELFVSMLEVYNEKIRDLLVDNFNQPAKKLEVKQSAEGTQEVPGLIEARVYGTDEVWELLQSGSRARSVGSTNANELSSRSHCLLRVTVVGENLINGQRTRSHLWLVDLAGSERVGRIEVEGERLKESQFINKSLSALGDVISSLASKTAHVPYRNSKLTHILQSSLGGDCKTLMFVQISPNVADLGETICSLNFASRVRGVEHGPARKQADLTELHKYKQMVEKTKNDEKETKKLQDSVQSLQLRLAAREHICRNLQEKVRDLENQLAEERKMRLKQENKALAAVSSQSSALPSANHSRKMTTERKPPLAPMKLRVPLRKITNLVPPASSIPPPKARNSFLPTVPEDKENVTMAGKSRAILKARRGSLIVRPLQATNQQHVQQPKRRASIAALPPEPTMITPIKSSIARPRNNHVMGRQSFVWDPQRLWRTSRVLSPQQKEKSSALVEATPVGPRSGRFIGTPRSSSKFMGSPPSQVGSWRPKHPTVVALQKKQLVWSPLKMKAMKSSSNRKSFLAP